MCHLNRLNIGILSQQFEIRPPKKIYIKLKIFCLFLLSVRDRERQVFLLRSLQRANNLLFGLKYPQAESFIL